MKGLDKIQGSDLIQGVLKLVFTGRYGKSLLISDISAALIVTLMLIPQSLAYALVAGLPPQAGLYASILPLIAYAFFGTSAALAVGPVAIISLLTANTLVPLAEVGTEAYAQMALVLAALSGLFYVVMGVFRLGFITQLLSYPVMKGYITASSVLIIVGQIKAWTGIHMERGNLNERLHSMDFSTLHWTSLIMGSVAMVLLFWARSASGTVVFQKLFGGFATMARRLLPMVLILISAIVTAAFSLQDGGLNTIGVLPKGLPSLSLPPVSWDLIQTLALPAFIITLIGMTESIAVGQTLGASKRQRISPDRELLGLGAANLAAGFSGGFPVTGGMSRSVVNKDAGAETPLAGAMTAVFLSIGILLLTPWLAYIPIPVLAATIIVAVSQLLEFPSMAKLLKMNRVDGLIAWITALAVMFWEVDMGILVGVVLSILWLLACHRKPFVAEVGLLPGSERFKNILNAETETIQNTVFYRIDESLTFLNAQVLEQLILEKIAADPNIERFVIVSFGIHGIDASGANMLKRIQQEMEAANIEFYMTDIKVPLHKKLLNLNVLPEDDSGRRFTQTTFELFSALKA